MKCNTQKKISLVIVIAILLAFIFVDYDNDDHSVLIDEEGLEESVSTISMMLETGVETGVYEVSDNTEWPTSGYVFNSTLSRCENGSSLEWDSTNNAVIVTSNVSDKCYIYFDVEVVKLAGAITYTSDSTDGTAGLYYFDGEGDYTNSSYEAVDYSYRYVGGTYILTSTASSVGYTTVDDTSSSTDTGVINFSCEAGSGSYIGESCSSSYTGYFYLNYDTEETQYSTYKEAAEQAVSDGYLEYGVMNYICFGSDADPCSNDNLYRIIGWFLNEDNEYEMKIIKADIATSDQLGGSGTEDYCGTQTVSTYTYRSYYKGTQSTIYWYYWNYVNYSSSYSNSGYYNDWYYSALNTVNLNTNYYGTLGSEWKNMISEHTWIVGGNTSSYIYNSTVKNSYNYELINYVTDQQASGYSGTVTSTYNANVGLMYVSDYGYAVLPSYWTRNLSSYSSTTLRENNWMYSGVYEWTISRASSSTYNAFYVTYSGGPGSTYIGGSNAVRPVLYLESSTKISSGSGTESDPYRIGM